MAGSTFCPHCGAKTDEYKHALSKGLVRVLVAMRDLGGSARTDELPLSRSDKDNAQKLRYWGLIAHNKKGDPWRLQPLAYRWLNGEARLWRVAVTYRGKTLRYEGPSISVRDVDPAYRQREDYLADQIPHSA